MSVTDTLFTTKLWCQYQSSNGKWVWWSDCCWNCYSTTWGYSGDDAFVLSVDAVAFQLCCSSCVCVDVQPSCPDYTSSHLPLDFYSVITNCCIDLTQFTFCVRIVSYLIAFPHFCSSIFALSLVYKGIFC